MVQFDRLRALLVRTGVFDGHPRPTRREVLCRRRIQDRLPLQLLRRGKPPRRGRPGLSSFTQLVDGCKMAHRAAPDSLEPMGEDQSYGHEISLPRTVRVSGWAGAGGVPIADYDTPRVLIAAGRQAQCGLQDQNLSARHGVTAGAGMKVGGTALIVGEAEAGNLCRRRTRVLSWEMGTIARRSGTSFSVSNKVMHDG